MLLGELHSPQKNLTPLVPSAVSDTKADDFVNVMKEDSFSDSDQVCCGGHFLVNRVRYYGYIYPRYLLCLIIPLEVLI